MVKERNDARITWIRTLLGKKEKGNRVIKKKEEERIENKLNEIDEQGANQNSKNILKKYW